MNDDERDQPDPKGPAAETEPDATPVGPAGPPPEEVEAYAAPPPETSPSETIAAHSVPATPLGESTRCPRCGTENRPGISFCHSCGQRLMAPGAPVAVARPAAPDGTQTCPRCGTLNRSGVPFCGNCGASLSAQPEATVTQASSGPRRAVLGPIVLLIGAIGMITAWLLPFQYGAGSLWDRSFGIAGGYGVEFWRNYPSVSPGLLDHAYFGFAAPVPMLGALLVLLAIGGAFRARPGWLQRAALAIALVWAISLGALFVVVELIGGPGGGLLEVLRALSPAGIIFLLSGLIVVIGALTRFARS
ncbi:MAG: zinc-ribbon domain-containing protein [Chloroflexota bacterium]|nr:zinc-ribbon domain-containing protein [Chloroflexota bacterium]